MPITVLMPALSPTMTEGNLARWLKQEGDTVKAGDVLAEIETDKATMEVEAVDEGKLGRILVQDGAQNVPVNQPIALLLGEGEDESDLDSALAAANKAKDNAAVAGTSAPAKQDAKPAPEAKAPEAKAPEAKAPEAAPAPAAKPAAAAPDAGARVFASPLARRIAAQNGLELSGVPGSGPNGRIVKADVEKALSQPRSAQPAAAAPAAAQKQAEPAAAAPAPAAKPAAAPAAGLDAKKYADSLGMAYEAVPNSGMRKVIARRLVESKQTVPHFYLTMDVRLEKLMDLRAQLNERGAKAEGAGAYKLSVNDFILKASAAALRRMPHVNASWTEEAVLVYRDVDVSVAVATPAGLITPVIKKADTKGLAAISNEMKELAKRARDGKLKPEEFQGGGFSVSNLGMYGIRDFGAIINPPQACILAVGAGEQRPVVQDGKLAIGTVMSMTLSVDHRVVDGAVGAEFLGVLKDLLEDPFALLV